MTKKCLLSLSLSVMMGIFLSGCTKSVQTAYYEVIPDNSVAVAGVKINRLFEKSEAGEKLLEWTRQHQMPGNREKLEAILKNGNESGLDLNENVYLFATTVEGTQGGVVAKMDDIAKLKEIFRLMQAEGGTEALTEKNGYFRTVVGDMVWLFNEHLWLGIVIQNTPEKAFEYAEQLLKQKSSGEIGKNECFKKLKNADSDMAFWVSFAEIAKNNDSAASYKLANGMDLSKADFLATLNFDPGKIDFSYELISEDPVVKAWMAMTGLMNNRFLNFFPSSTIFYWGGNLDGEKIAEQLKNDKELTSQLKIDNLNESLKILSAFKGDFSLGVPSFSPIGIPSILAYAEVRDAYPAEALARTLQQQATEVKKVGANAYETRVPMLGMTIYFGVKDKSFYLTDDASLYSDLNKEVAKPLGNTPQAAGLKNATMAGILNIEEALQSPVVQMGIYQMTGQREGASLLQTLSIFSYAELLGNANKVRLNIYLKDKEQNSLKTLVEEGERLTLR